MKLYIFPFIVLLLNGCTVTYLKDDNESLSYSSLSGCPATFHFSGSSDYNQEDIKEGSDFWLGPHTDDYIDWIKDTLVEQGCNTQYSNDFNADLSIHVHEHYMSGDRNQGAAIIGLLTLFLVPLPNETPYRDVSFTYQEQKTVHKLKEKSWSGWYFLPVHIASYLPHDKYFIIEKLEQIINYE